MLYICRAVGYIKDPLLTFGNIFPFINVLSMSAITLQNILNTVYRCQTRYDLFVARSALPRTIPYDTPLICQLITHIVLDPNF